MRGRQTGQSCPTRRRRRHRRQALVRQFLNVTTGAAALAWIVRWFLERSVFSWSAGTEVLLVLTAFTASCASIVWQQRVWSLPLRRMKRLLPRIAGGAEPIESLSRIDGAPAELVPVLRELLHALRRQSADTSALHAELGERVARRTDALQRTIGSLRRQTMRDPLTGLYNRRALDQEFPALLERCREQEQELCVVLADLDYFKRLNDTLGHAAGDQFLREVGQLIRSSLREEDLAFRHGGDEFVILLPDCSMEQARTVVQRLQQLVEALGKSLKLPHPPRLSAGISASGSGDDASVEHLTRQADQRLYQQKRRRAPAA